VLCGLSVLFGSKSTSIILHERDTVLHALHFTLRMLPYVTLYCITLWWFTLYCII